MAATQVNGHPNWIRGALTDERGQWDVAYISLAALMVATVGPIVVMTAMGVWSYFRCVPNVLLVKEAVTVIACTYDPQPLGNAIGFACGGFGVALAALAGYMAATRRPQAAASVTTTVSARETTTTVDPPPAIPATATSPAEPLPVNIVKMPDEQPKAAKGKGKPRGR